MLALKDQDVEKAQAISDKQRMLAEIFEMGEYYEALAGHEVAVAKKDVEATLASMQKMLASLGEINHFVKAPLYGHMAFRETREEFVEQLKEELMEAFRDKEAYGFLKGDRRWEELVNSCP